ncbi:MAG: endolytic transglycosylase MltG [Candidatus Solibacter usitatus]|nr:endolytic transglycosylase MltG [Candidatus Solibacter usitatus]
MARRRKLLGRAIAATAVLACTAALVSFQLQSPYADFKGEILVDIPRGAGTRQIAFALEEAGVVRSAWRFLIVRGLRPRAKLQAGEYRFDAAASPWRVFDRITRGDVFYYEITIPEGSNIYDIGQILEANRLISSAAFLTAARDPGLVRDIAPAAPTLEGYLFPATYKITRHTTAAQLCRDMTSRFRQAWREARGGVNVHATVTLASLIEKETGVPDERPVVSSVFRNRLEQRMKLDCDPTTIYAALLQGRYTGVIHRSDLASRHSFNTYQHEGLPPGPIANPGLKSIQAALHPAHTTYLYFVAKPDGSGGHVFSTNVVAHNKAVGEYRRGLQKAKGAGAAQRNNRAGKSRGD